nr:unnamed protein product [Digitaria exilis]
MPTYGNRFHLAGMLSGFRPLPRIRKSSAMAGFHMVLLCHRNPMLHLSSTLLDDAVLPITLLHTEHNLRCLRHGPAQRCLCHCGRPDVPPHLMGQGLRGPSLSFLLPLFFVYSNPSSTKDFAGGAAYFLLFNLRGVGRRGDQNKKSRLDDDALRGGEQDSKRAHLPHPDHKERFTMMGGYGALHFGPCEYHIKVTGFEPMALYCATPRLPPGTYGMDLPDRKRLEPQEARTTAFRK